MTSVPIVPESTWVTAPGEAVREYLRRGIAMPHYAYTSTDLFDLEMSTIFRSSWLYAAHESQLAAPGSYLSVEIGTESVLLTRNADGHVRALLNVCRHRGARLVDRGHGTTRRFTCPYHQWTYGLDGHLEGAPRMPAGFDRRDYGLQPVHVTTWQGLVFVNFHPGIPEPLRELFAPAADLVTPYRTARCKVAHEIIYHVAANWKLVWENSQECYHCNANHPEFIKSFDLRETNRPDSDKYSLDYTHDRRVQFARFPLRGTAASLTMNGEPACSVPLGDFADGRPPQTVAHHLKPGFAMVMCADYGVVFCETPLEISHTEVRMQWLVHSDAVEDRDYQLDNLLHVWDQTNLQDWQLCARTQAGVRSHGFIPGPLSLDETSVAGFYLAYASMLDGTAG